MSMIHRHKKTQQPAEKPVVVEKAKVVETPKVEAVENVVTATYTKTDINRMSKDDLVKLATDNGIDTTDKSGSELKKTLIEYFKLD